MTNAWHSVCCVGENFRALHSSPAPSPVGYPRLDGGGCFDVTTKHYRDAAPEHEQGQSRARSVPRWRGIVTLDCPSEISSRAPAEPPAFGRVRWLPSGERRVTLSMRKCKRNSNFVSEIVTLREGNISEKSRRPVPPISGGGRRSRARFASYSVTPFCNLSSLCNSS